jgi:hypothetical protein
MITNNAAVIKEKTNLATKINKADFFHADFEKHIGDKDLLSVFKANLAQVEDLHERVRFVMGEVQHIIKKRT